MKRRCPPRALRCASRPFGRGPGGRCADLGTAVQAAAPVAAYGGRERRLSRRERGRERGGRGSPKSLGVRGADSIDEEHRA